MWRMSHGTRYSGNVSVKKHLLALRSVVQHKCSASRWRRRWASTARHADLYVGTSIKQVRWKSPSTFLLWEYVFKRQLSQLSPPPPPPTLNWFKNKGLSASVCLSLSLSLSLWRLFLCDYMWLCVSVASGFLAVRFVTGSAAGTCDTVCVCVYVCVCVRARARACVKVCICVKVCMCKSVVSGASHCHTYARTYPPPPQPHTHSLTLSLSHIHSHTHTHTRTHARTHAHIHMEGRGKTHYMMLAKGYQIVQRDDLPARFVSTWCLLPVHVILCADTRDDETCRGDKTCRQRINFSTSFKVTKRAATGSFGFTRRCQRNTSTDALARVGLTSSLVAQTVDAITATDDVRGRPGSVLGLRRGEVCLRACARARVCVCVCVLGCSGWGPGSTWTLRRPLKKHASSFTMSLT